MNRSVINQHKATELHQMDKVLQRTYKMSPEQVDTFHALFPVVDDPNLASEILDDLLEDRLERL